MHGAITASRVRRYPPRMAKKKRKLPAALAQRDVAAAKNKLARIRDAARADIALIMAKRFVIEDAFLDIGEALKRLKPPAVWRALGRKSFAHLASATSRWARPTRRRSSRS